MEKNTVQVELLVNGKSIHEYKHEGNTYVEGRKGKSFAIKITNNHVFNKVLAVVSVDGLSVINSEKASESSPGYVVHPNSTMIVDGWRINDDNVSEFVFNKKANGYASAIGKDGHEGSIGVMIFEDNALSVLMETWKHQNQPWNGNTIFRSHGLNNHDSSGVLNSPNMNISNVVAGGNVSDYSCDTIPVLNKGTARGVLRSKASTTDFMEMDSTKERRIDVTPDEKLAVGHGEQVESKVKQVEFEAMSSPSNVFALFYDTRKGLEKRGIEMSVKPAIVEPSPFPASNTFCDMPEGGWKK